MKGKSEYYKIKTRRLFIFWNEERSSGAKFLQEVKETAVTSTQDAKCL
jgi:hypothetical protein